jgi:hypothetical protein
MARNDPHAQLTNSQKQILEDLYDAAGVTSVDQLPYTDAIDRITAEFNGTSGLDLSEADIWKALKNLGRQGRLGRRMKGGQSSAVPGSDDSGVAEVDPPAGSGQ